jgi:lactoylglutathione lyase
VPETETTPSTAGRTVDAAMTAAIPPREAPPTTIFRAPIRRTARTAAPTSAAAFPWFSYPFEKPSGTTRKERAFSGSRSRVESARSRRAWGGSNPRQSSPSRIRGMGTFLHTMVRITDPERSRAFYEALGFKFSRDMDIVRNGELEATNYFFSIGDQQNVLELTFNHDGRSYELGTGYGHIAIGVDDLDSTLAALKDDHGIEPERPPYQVREGGSRICFVRDPDDYRIELIERG